MASGRRDDGVAAGGAPDDGWGDRVRGSMERGRSTRGGCEEYRVGLSSVGEVGGSGTVDDGARVGKELGTCVGGTAGGTGREGGAFTAEVVPEAVRIRSSASAARVERSLGRLARTLSSRDRSLSSRSLMMPSLLRACPRWQEDPLRPCTNPKPFRRPRSPP